MKQPDRDIAGNWAMTVDTVFDLLKQAAASDDAEAIGRLQRAARSQMSVCDALAKHVRRALAAGTGTARPVSAVRSQLQECSCTAADRPEPLEAPMGVTQSREPISLTAGSSQLSGGLVADNAGAQMSAPGSPPAAPAPGDLSLTQHQPPSFGSGSDVSEGIVTDAGAALGHGFLPPGVVRGPDGRWAQADTGTAAAGLWRPTPSSA
jgi:hypothetical protein